MFRPCIGVERGVGLRRVDPSVHWRNEICVVGGRAIAMKSSIAEDVVVDVDGVPARCRMVVRELVSLGI